MRISKGANTFMDEAKKMFLKRYKEKYGRDCKISGGWPTLLTEHEQSEEESQIRNCRSYFRILD